MATTAFNLHNALMTNDGEALNAELSRLLVTKPSEANFKTAIAMMQAITDKVSYDDNPEARASRELAVVVMERPRTYAYFLFQNPDGPDLTREVKLDRLRQMHVMHLQLIDKRMARPRATTPQQKMEEFYQSIKPGITCTDEGVAHQIAERLTALLGTYTLSDNAEHAATCVYYFFQAVRIVPEEAARALVEATIAVCDRNDDITAKQRFLAYLTGKDPLTGVQDSVRTMALRLKG